MIVFHNAGTGGRGFSYLECRDEPSTRLEGDVSGPGLYLRLRPNTGILLNQFQVLKLRDELNQWLGKHAAKSEQPPLWEGSLL